MSYDLIIRGGTVVDGTRLPRLRAGAPADIVVYDLEKLRITPEGGHDVVYDYPANEWRRVQRAEGYRWILVNGEVTFEDGKATGATLKAFCNGWAGASGWC